MSPLADIDAEPDGLPLEVEDFLVWLATERGRAANTLAAYRRDLRAYCRHLADCGHDVLTADSDAVPEPQGVNGMRVHRYTGFLQQNGYDRATEPFHAQARREI